MLKNRYYFILVFCFILLSGCCHSAGRDVFYQVSTIQALSAGCYDGKAGLCSLKRHGDFGIGTFRGLDGEMLVMDGIFYQVKVDGKAYPVTQASGIPFAQVTFFEADQVFTINRKMDYAGLARYLDTLLASKNIFYAVKITGKFQYMKVRSVARQSPPYPTLKEALKGQKVFEFHDITGTLVGWRSPACTDKIGVSGYHLHFISEDRQKGGHLLDCMTSDVRAELDATTDFYLVLPDNTEFLDLDLELTEEGMDAKKA